MSAQVYPVATRPTELRQIPGYPLYSITNDGRVFSSITNRFLKNGLSQAGYPRIRLASTLGAKQRTCEVHALVALTWIGPRPDGLDVAHLDGNPANSHVSNLVYVTRKENMGHRDNHGTHLRGERSSSVKITEAQAREIRFRKTPRRGDVIAMTKEFGLSRAQITDIRSGKKWSHIK